MNNENLSDNTSSNANDLNQGVKKPWSTPEITKGGSMTEITRQVGSPLAGIKIGSVFVETAASDPLIDPEQDPGLF
jgi:hypothetical protein